MGENSSHPVFTINGIDLSDCVTFNPDVESALSPLSGFNGGSMQFEIKRPKFLRCKSRKRFIKLLMSRGTPRNMAVKAAKLKPPGESYDAMWFWLRLMFVGGFIFENQT
jgi:hypothetical protein